VGTARRKGGPPDCSAAHRRPLSRGSNPCGYPHKPLVSYRINRSGWIPPPLMIRAFGAHCQQPTYAAQQNRSFAVGTRVTSRPQIPDPETGSPIAKTCSTPTHSGEYSRPPHSICTRGDIIIAANLLIIPRAELQSIDVFLNHAQMDPESLQVDFEWACNLE
jgi:hypothetical protein